MTEFLAILIIFGLVLIILKIIGLLFKTTIFIISFPLTVLLGLMLTVLIIALLPVTVVAGILALLLAPFGLLAPLLPFLLIGLGIYMLAR